MLTRLTLRSMAAPAAAALFLLCAAGLLLEAAALVLRAAVTPGARTTLQASLVLLPAVLEYTLPVALLVGLCLAYGRWSTEGTWIALRASGVSGRRLLPAALLAGLLAALLMAATTHSLAPEGRRAAARTLQAASSEARLLPGHFVQLGEVLMRQDPAGDLLVISDELALVASSGRLEASSGGLVLELSAGRALATAGEQRRLSFDSATIPLALEQGSRRVELAERSASELSGLIARMRDRGKAASYERAVLLKRSTMPLALLVLPLLALPLGLRWRGQPSHMMAVVVGYWVLLRLGDQHCHALGPHLAAALPLLGLALAAALCWSRWRDR